MSATLLRLDHLRERSLAAMPDRGRQVAVDRGEGTQQRGEGAVLQRGGRVRRHVRRRDLPEQAGLDAEEPADPIQGRDGLVAELTVAEDEHPLAGEAGVEAAQLLAVTAQV